jgi:hypothetical protein
MCRCDSNLGNAVLADDLADERARHPEARVPIWGARLEGRPQARPNQQLSFETALRASLG